MWCSSFHFPRSYVHTLSLPHEPVISSCHARLCRDYAEIEQAREKERVIARVRAQDRERGEKKGDWEGERDRRKQSVSERVSRRACQRASKRTYHMWERRDKSENVCVKERYLPALSPLDTIIQGLFRGNVVPDISIDIRIKCPLGTGVVRSCVRGEGKGGRGERLSRARSTEEGKMAGRTWARILTRTYEVVLPPPPLHVRHPTPPHSNQTHLKLLLNHLQPHSEVAATPLCKSSNDFRLYRVCVRYTLTTTQCLTTNTHPHARNHTNATYGFDLSRLSAVLARLRRFR